MTETNSRGSSTSNVAVDERDTTPPQEGSQSWLALIWTEKGFDAVGATAALLSMALPVGTATIWLGSGVRRVGGPGDHHRSRHQAARPPDLRHHPIL